MPNAFINGWSGRTETVLIVDHRFSKQQLHLVNPVIKVRQLFNSNEGQPTWLGVGTASFLSCHTFLSFSGFIPEIPLRHMNVLVGLCLALLVTRAAGVVQAGYSAFSGLVADVTVGTPGQSLPLSLDFHKAETYLYTHESLPPFVREAYSLSLSSTPRTGAQIMFFDGETDWGPILMGYEFITFDGRRQSVPVNIVARRFATSTRLSEVAGVLGLGRNSAFMSGRSLLAYRDTWLSPSKVMLAAGVTDRASDIIASSTSESEWRFRAELVFCPTFRWQGDVVLDLSEQDLVLPLALRDSYLAAVSGVLSSDRSRVLVPCTRYGRPRGRLSLVMTILGSRKGVVKITTESLILPPRQSDGSHCELRVRFAQTDLVKIGRQLLESVARIELDYATGTIGLIHLIIDPALIRPPVPRGQPLIPILGDPTWDAVSQTLSFPTVHNGEGLVLLSDRLELRSGTLAWRFARTHAHLQASSAQVLPGVFERVNLVKTRRGLILNLLRQAMRNEPNFRVIVERTPEFLSVIVVRQRHRLVDDLDLPGTYTKLASADEAVDCGVCLEPMKEGDTIQPMKNCQHEFHASCINKWLEGAGQSCPTCRAPVDVTTEEPPYEQATGPAEEVEVRAPRYRSCVVS